jgi:hypothetical protein
VRAIYRTIDFDGASAAGHTEETSGACIAEAGPRVMHAANKNGIGRTDAVVE